MIEKPSQDCEASLVIGKPYEYGAKGPDSFDCMGLVQWWFLNHHGIELGDFPRLENRSRSMFQINDIDSHKSWNQIEKPVEGCVVAMSRSKIFHHVGLWIDGACIHCHEDAGCVVSDSIAGLRNKHFSKIITFKHCEQ